MSTMENYILVEISRSDWHKLGELWADKPTQTPGYQCIVNFINWSKKDPNLDIKFLSLNGDWQQDGTFIITLNQGNRQQHHLYFNSLSDNLTKLTKAVEILPATADQYLLFGYDSRLAPVANAYAQRFPNKETHLTETLWYHAAKDLVSSFIVEVPSGITLRNLDVKDAETINNIWPHRSSNSVNFVKRLIEYNVNVGAYDETGKLVAWCLRLPIGALGLLQVLESHKRLGLGSLLVRCLSKKIAALGDEVLAPVVIKNVASRNMFEKLGFQSIGKVNWSG